MELTSENVERIFMDCLFKEGEDTSNYIPAEGVTTNVGFHPERIESHKDEIASMLSELPEEFKEKTGGGWTFLNAFNDKNGQQWTSLHRRMEQLFQLGIGIGKVSYLMPRDMWRIFPGGMPYLVIKD